MKLREMLKVRPNQEITIWDSAFDCEFYITSDYVTGSNMMLLDCEVIKVNNRGVVVNLFERVEQNKEKFWDYANENFRNWDTTWSDDDKLETWLFEIETIIHQGYEGYGELVASWLK